MLNLGPRSSLSRPSTNDLIYSACRLRLWPSPLRSHSSPPETALSRASLSVTHHVLGRASSFGLSFPCLSYATPRMRRSRTSTWPSSASGRSTLAHAPKQSWSAPSHRTPLGARNHPRAEMSCTPSYPIVSSPFFRGGARRPQRPHGLKAPTQHSTSRCASGPPSPLRGPRLKA